MRTLPQLPPDSLPLFQVADARQRRQEVSQLSFPARWLCRRVGSLSPLHARVIADLHFGGAR